MGLGHGMTGVLGAMRQSAKSCSSRCSILLAGSTLLGGAGTAHADTLRVLNVLGDLSHQEIAALGLVFAIVGFSVVATILYLRSKRLVRGLTEPELWLPKAERRERLS